MNKKTLHRILILSLLSLTAHAGQDTDNGGSICQLEGQKPMLCDHLIQTQFNGILPYTLEQKRSYDSFAVETQKELRDIEYFLSFRYGTLFPVQSIFLDIAKTTEYYAVDSFLSRDTDPGKPQQKQVAAAYTYSKIDFKTSTRNPFHIVEINEARLSELNTRDQALLLIHETLHSYGYTHEFIYPFIRNLGEILRIHDDQRSGKNTQLSPEELQIVKEFDLTFIFLWKEHFFRVRSQSVLAYVFGPKDGSGSLPDFTVEPKGGGTIRGLGNNPECAEFQQQLPWVGVGASINLEHRASCFGADHYPEKIQDEYRVIDNTSIQGTQVYEKDHFFSFKRASAVGLGTLRKHTSLSAGIEGSLYGNTENNFFPFDIEWNSKTGIERATMAIVSFGDMTGYTIKLLTTGLSRLPVSHHPLLKNELVRFKGELANDLSAVDVNGNFIYLTFPGAGVGTSEEVGYTQGKWRANLHIDGQIINNPTPTDDKANQQKAAYTRGLGVSYAATPRLSLQASVDQLHEPNFYHNGSTDDFRVKAGVDYRFELTLPEQVRKSRKQNK